MCVLTAINFTNFIVDSFINCFVDCRDLTSTRTRPFFRVVLSVVLAVPLVTNVCSLPRGGNFAHVNLFCYLFTMIRFFNVLVSVPFCVRGTIRNCSVKPVPRLVLCGLLELLGKIVIVLVTIRFFENYLGEGGLVVLVSLLTL